MLIRIRMALLIQINRKVVARLCRTAITTRIDLLVPSDAGSERLS
jgi:hypothetical protein